MTSCLCRKKAGLCWVVDDRMSTHASTWLFHGSGCTYAVGSVTGILTVAPYFISVAAVFASTSMTPNPLNHPQTRKPTDITSQFLLSIDHLDVDAIIRKSETPNVSSVK